MRTSMLSLGAFLLASSSAVALAEGLVVEPSSPHLVATTFDYRYDSTRTWLLGCFGYDVLQGTGFFPQVWYHSGTFTPADGDYRFAWQRTWIERFCAAKQSQYNYVQLTWTDPNDPNRVFRGVMQVEAGGRAKVAEVNCELVDPDSPYNALQCDRAIVDLASAGDTFAIVHLTNLD